MGRECLEEAGNVDRRGRECLEGECLEGEGNVKKGKGMSCRGRYYLDMSRNGMSRRRMYRRGGGPA